MRRLLASLAVAAMMTVFGGNALQAENAVSLPSADVLESLIEQSQRDSHPEAVSILRYRDATLLAFELVRWTQVGSRSWRAEALLAFDYGASPPGIIGFERRRAGLYQLLVDHRDGAWRLRRFTEASLPQLLPVARR